MKVAGIGAMTTKGLEIVDFCKNHNVALEFYKFVASENVGLSLTQLNTPAQVPYNDLPHHGLLSVLSLGGFEYYEGTVSKSSNILSSSQSILQILLSIVSNDIEENIDLYDFFISCKDQNGAEIFCAEHASFAAGASITFDAPFFGTADVEYMDSTRGSISISNIKDSLGVSLTYDEFVAQCTTPISFTDGATTGNILIPEGIQPSYDVIYKGCYSYDERLTITVADSTGFVIGGYISNAIGASAEITGKSGNVLTCNRTNTKLFSVNDAVDNASVFVAGATTIALTPTIDGTNSTLLPITYFADGSSILTRVNIRSTAGWPTSYVFQDSAITEIEVHNADEIDSHVDLRMGLIQVLSVLGQDIRENAVQIQSIKNQLNAIFTANGITGTII